MIPTRAYANRHWVPVLGTEWHWDTKSMLCGKDEKHIYLTEIRLIGFYDNTKMYLLDNNSQVFVCDGEALYIVQYTVEQNRRLKRIVWRREYSILIEVT